jgi:hypothetical protein
MASWSDERERDAVAGKICRKLHLDYDTRERKNFRQPDPQEGH